MRNHHQYQSHSLPLDPYMVINFCKTDHFPRKSLPHYHRTTHYQHLKLDQTHVKYHNQWQWVFACNQVLKYDTPKPPKIYLPVLLFPIYSHILCKNHFIILDFSMKRSTLNRCGKKSGCWAAETFQWGDNFDNFSNESNK